MIPGMALFFTACGKNSAAVALLMFSVDRP